MIKINRSARQQKPEKVWLVTKQSQLSFAQQWQRCNAILDWCKKMAIAQGSFILVAVTDELEQASLLTALISIGQTPVILDPEATAAEIKPILDTLAYTAVIAETTIFQKWQLEKYQKPFLPVVTTRKHGSLFGRLLAKKQVNDVVDSWPAISNSFSGQVASDPKPEGLAYLIFTSGTTSSPKGVEISKLALESQLNLLCSKFELLECSRILNVLPMHHADGFVQGPLLAWYAGCSVYRPVSFSASTIPSYMDSIYRDRITHMIAVPTMLALILRLGKEFAENFKSADFRFIISCAGHLESTLWKNFEQAFEMKLINLYGLTETVTSALINGPDQASRRLGTLGLAINCEVQIILENSLQADIDEIGELLISGEQLMDGYYGDPDATNAILKNGWLHTGDLVKKLSTGHIELVGRLKNLIISGGRNISPEEVAACLNTHPCIVESVVLGVADQDWGEVVSAMIIVEGAISEADLVLWCRERLSEYKIPRRILQVSEFKKGPSGKIQIEAAKQQMLELLSIKVSSIESVENIESIVLAEAAACFRMPISQLSLDSGPDNTQGWNSLEHMELVLALEARFGFKFTAREIMQIENLGTASRICLTKVSV